VVKNVFLCICAYFHTTRFKSLKNYFFHLWSGKKRVFMHFLATIIKFLKIYFFTSGVVKNVFLCICAYFQTTRIKSLKNYFFHLWSGLKRVLMHFLATRIKFLKILVFHIRDG
jgi:hypothetical protein